MKDPFYYEIHPPHLFALVLNQFGEVHLEKVRGFVGIPSPAQVRAHMHTHTLQGLNELLREPFHFIAICL